MNSTVKTWLGKSQEELDEIYRNAEPGKIPEGDTSGTAILAGSVFAKIVAFLAGVLAWQGKIFGLFRLLTIRFLLLLLDYSARHVYNHGFLTRIRTIHFARWVLMDNNRRIYFASNYDGSHEAYMDDFINKVAWGLNLVFSNGVGYPPTRWLVKGGAEQEQKYKYTLRRHQLPSEVWYKAYPELTAYDLSRNSRIRQGVDIRQESDAEICEWLSLI